MTKSVGGVATKVFERGALGIGSQIVSAGVQGVVSNALTQGVGVLTGLQDRFSWSAVAAAGVGGAANTAIGGRTPIGRAAAGVAGGIAGAAATSLVTGRDFGDTLISSLPSIIGNTVGSLLATELESRGRGTRAPRSTDNAEQTPLERAKAQIAAMSDDSKIALEALAISYEATDRGVQFGGFDGRKGAVKLNDGREVFSGDDGEYIYDPDIMPIIRTGATSPDGIVRGADGGDIRLQFFNQDASNSIKSIWFGYAGEAGATRLLINQSGIGAIYEGGNQVYDSLGVYVQYGSRFQPSIALEARNNYWVSATGGQSLSSYDPGLTGPGGYLYAFSYRFEEALATRQAAISNFNKTDLSLGGLGRGALGVAQGAFGAIQAGISPLTGLVDLGRAAYFGRGFQPDIEDRNTTDIGLALVSGVEFSLSRSLALNAARSAVVAKGPMFSSGAALDAIPLPRAFLG